jgi:hypothetical protein
VWCQPARPPAQGVLGGGSGAVALVGGVSGLWDSYADGRIAPRSDPAPTSTCTRPALEPIAGFLVVLVAIASAPAQLTSSDVDTAASDGDNSSQRSTRRPHEVGGQRSERSEGVTVAKSPLAGGGLEPSPMLGDAACRVKCRNPLT